MGKVEKKEVCEPKCIKKDGGRDHRCNRGADRNPAQRAGDAKRRKN